MLNAILLGALVAAAEMPHVTPQMRSPDYWISRMKAPDHVLMSGQEIGWFNAAVYRTGYRMRPYTERMYVPRRRIVGEIEAQLRELTKWRKFDRNNARLRDGPFLEIMRGLIGLERIPARTRVRYCVNIRGTSIRLMPTDMFLRRRPDDDNLDILQLSFLTIGQPMVLYHRSADRKWGWVQTPVCAGWVRMNDIALGRNRDEAANFFRDGPFLVVIGTAATLYSDAKLSAPLGRVGMGSVLRVEGGGDGCAGVRIPLSLKGGWLAEGKGYVRLDGGTHEGFMKFTPRNVVKQAFKYLGAAYGWGDWGDSVDCSRFIHNVFATFGLELPRTSHLQVECFNRVETRKPKAEVLLGLPPAATVLGLPGHVALYLGTEGGRFYAIHSLGAYRVTGAGGEEEVQVRKVVVSDLSLGEGTAKGSFLEQLSGLSVAGPPGE